MLLRISLSLLIFPLWLLRSAQVTTAQYDNARTGANLEETILNAQNVNSKQFGKLFSLGVDGDVYAQPLYLPELSLPGKGTHNVIFIATEHDSVYAFDAAGEPRAPLWKTSYADSSRGITPVPAQSVHCPFIAPEIGITSTPVIDPQTQTLYVLVRTRERDSSGTMRFWQRLHALDARTGTEKFGGPMVIRASLSKPKTGLFGLFSGDIDFSALRENPRAALALANGKIYVAWGSSCDVGPYHGWVIAYDAHTLRQISAFNTSPNDEQSGIWQSDTGPAVDEEGNLFLATGNGRFDAVLGGGDYGDSVLKLGAGSHGLEVKDYFTPLDQEQLNARDQDVGSGGPVLVPQQPGSNVRLLVVGGKGAVIYVINRDHMGRYRAENNSHAIQTIRVEGEIKGAPAYWNGHLYYFPGDDVLKDFAVQGGRLSAQPMAQAQTRFTDPGATPTVSANGTKNGIVWAIEAKGGANNVPAVLRAYNAENVANEIYNSMEESSRDRAGPSCRFTIPTVANGRVYVGASGELDVYGLLPEVKNSRAGVPKRPRR